MKNSIKIINKISPLGLEKIEDQFNLGEDIENPEGILVRSAKVTTNDYSNLLAVARAGAGFNNITVDEATQNGVCVFNTPGANANAVAELILTMLGYTIRNIKGSIDYVGTLNPSDSDVDLSKQVEANKSNFRGSEIIGKTLSVIGLGKIGVLVCNYAINHGMKVNAYDPYLNAMNVHQLNAKVQISSSFADCLKGADVVSVHVPLNDKTKSLISTTEINSLNDNCILMNFARDGIYDDDSIDEGLKSGKVGHYISDFPKSRFLNNDKVISVPHLGASTSESEENCAIMACDQISNYLNFGNIKNSVNFPPIELPVNKKACSRLLIINKDVPNMISLITKAIGEAGVNIQSFANESNGNIGYNLIDIDCPINDDVLHSIEKLENVIKVRLIRFL